jgi:hypothetical protein
LAVFVLALATGFVSLGVLALVFVAGAAFATVGVGRAVFGAAFTFGRGASLIVDGAGAGGVTDVLAG